MLESLELEVCGRKKQGNYGEPGGERHRRRNITGRDGVRHGE